MHSFTRLPAALVGLFAAGAGLVAAEEYPKPYVNDYEAYNIGDYGIHPNQTFKTTDAMALLPQVNQWKPEKSGLSRYLFVSSLAGRQDATPFIIDTKDFSTMYADPAWGSVNNPRIQMYNGLPYFTFWEGRDYRGHGLGHCLLYDTSYQQVYNVSTKMINTKADSHECQLTDDGTALITAYEKIPYDMTNAPGGNGPVDGILLDSIFEEIDIATGELKFLWRASHHFDLNETEVNWGYHDYGADTEEVGWDFFHINSMQKTREGNYLVSGRRIKSIVYISGKDGSVIWQLGGKNNQFTDLSGGKATDFGFQHTVRFLNDEMTEITLFDNHDLNPSNPSPGCTEGCSRGLHLRINTEDMTVEVLHEYYHPMRIASWAMGGFQKLDNGNVLVSWGTTPVITEYTEDGEIVLDMMLGPWYAESTNSQPVYRAWTMDWTAFPTWAPKIAGDEKFAYVSWNGATEVDSWDIMEGHSTDDIAFTQNVKKAGYETVVPLKTDNAKYIAANALAADGTVLGTSDVWDMTLKKSFPGGASGYCTIGCGGLDSIDSMILLLMSFSGCLLIIMVWTRRRA